MPVTTNCCEGDLPPSLSRPLTPDLRRGFLLAQTPALYEIAPMKTVSLKLPDAVAGWLEAQARSRRISKSNLVRELLVPQPSQPRRGAVLAILQEAWSAKVPATPRRWRSVRKQKLADLIRGKKLHR